MEDTIYATRVVDTDGPFYADDPVLTGIGIGIAVAILIAFVAQRGRA